MLRPLSWSCLRQTIRKSSLRGRAGIVVDMSFTMVCSRIATRPLRWGFPSHPIAVKAFANYAYSTGEQDRTVHEIRNRVSDVTRTDTGVDVESGLGLGLGSYVAASS